VLVKISRDLAWAAATDVGNASAREGGRKAWDSEDYNKAVAEFGRLWRPFFDGYDENEED
jgi:hypothetical protein